MNAIEQWENTLHLGNCLEIMEDIPSNSIDMIFTDLPYNLTKCHWDKMIDLDRLWIQYKRISKENTPILLFAQTPFDKILGYSNIEMLKYEWIYEKNAPTGHLNAKKMPLKAHENILVFYNKLPVYNPQKTTGHKPVNTYTKTLETANNTQVYGKTNHTVSGGGNTDRYPRSVLKMSTDIQKNRETGISYPTQKPLEICKYMIRTYTNHGNIVLDSCMGSGTIPLAAKLEGRSYIGIDNNPVAVNIAKQRIL
jgi:DNA modification methylase